MNSRINVNGFDLETNKRGLSMDGSHVTFGDGSTWNMRTGAFKNVGGGYVKVGGKMLVDNDGSSESRKGQETKTRAEDFPGGKWLSLGTASARVVVEMHNKPGMRVEITGPSEDVDNVELNEYAGRLSVRESSASRGSNSISVSGGSIVMGSFGGSVSINGMSISGGTSFDDSVAITVYVPVQAAITVLASGGDVKIKKVNGPLTIDIGGNAEVTASDASGNVQVDINGNGEATIKDGAIDNLTASVHGNGEIKIGGTAQKANLSVHGNGEIKIARVIHPPTKSIHGNGEIKIKRIG